MRGVVLLTVVAGCGFQHGAAPTGGDDNGPPDDGPPMVVDTQTIDARPIDAPCDDDDEDGDCNDADDWPCGVAPAAPAAPMTMSGNNGDTSVTISQVQVDATGRLAVATPNEMISLGFHYNIDDTACPQACVDQIEVGWVPGSRYACPFDNTVSSQNGAQGNINMQIRVPAMPGVYDLRTNIGQNLSCTHAGANSWWGGTPATSRTIAKVCVH